MSDKKTSRDMTDYSYPKTSEKSGLESSARAPTIGEPVIVENSVYLNGPLNELPDGCIEPLPETPIIEPPSEDPMIVDPGDLLDPPPQRMREAVTLPYTKLRDKDK